ncbi:MAG: TetR/AcrR family transcriptional regulator [Treponema sp.]|nr:TetR/AcrR family transcriptional regulator [Candidatus Treponema equifaecale]
MAIVVEHDKRKHEILEKSLELFTKEGYDDVTFQKIADACGITRTTLYIYFKNKREIFSWSIKQMSAEMEVELRKIIKDKELTATECLRKMMFWLIDTCSANKPLFNVLLIYLINLQKTGENIEELVNRRVLRAKHLLSMIIIAGQKRNEFKKMPVKQVNNMFYGLIESSIFELSVLNSHDISGIKETVENLIHAISA